MIYQLSEKDMLELFGWKNIDIKNDEGVIVIRKPVLKKSIQEIKHQPRVYVSDVL